MYCPNCGKDCGEFKFCPECGQELEEKTKEQSFEDKKKRLQAEGQVYCPDCLSTNYRVDKEERRRVCSHSILVSLLELIHSCMNTYYERRYGVFCTCLQCGRSWFPKVEKVHECYREQQAAFLCGKSAKRLTGTDEGYYIELNWNQVVICRAGKKKAVILYNNLVNAEYTESQDSACGRLSIRDRKRKLKPLPKTLKAAKRDRLTILYTPDCTEEYREAYAILKRIAEENKKAKIV